MSQQDKKANMLIMLAANYGREFPEELFALWLDLLEPYSPAEVNAAIRQVVCEYEYKTIPPFAVLKKALDKTRGKVDPERLLAMQADAEWSKLLRLAASRGAYNPPDDLHPTTAFVVAGMGGWGAVCAWETRNIEWRRKEFCQAWQNAHGYVPLVKKGADHLERIGGPPSAGAVLANTFSRVALELPQ